MVVLLAPWEWQLSLPPWVVVASPFVVVVALAPIAIAAWWWCLPLVLDGGCACSFVVVVMLLAPSLATVVVTLSVFSAMSKVDMPILVEVPPTYTAPRSRSHS